MSNMSRIADYIENITDSDEEYNKVCIELSKHWKGELEYKDLSKKAFATLMTWEDENKDVPINEDVNEWEGA